MDFFGTSLGVARPFVFLKKRTKHVLFRRPRFALVSLLVGRPHASLRTRHAGYFNPEDPQRQNTYNASPCLSKPVLFTGAVGPWIYLEKCLGDKGLVEKCLRLRVLASGWVRASEIF